LPIIKLVPRNSQFFQNRKIAIMSFGKRDIREISIPNNLILCDICNDEIKTSKIMLLFLSKRDKQPYGTLCLTCKKKYHSKVKIVNI